MPMEVVWFPHSQIKCLELPCKLLVGGRGTCVRECSAAGKWEKWYQNEPFQSKSGQHTIWHKKRVMETVFRKMFSSQGTWELTFPGCSYQLNLCSFPHLFAMFSSHTVLFTQGAFWRSSKGQVINLPLSFSCRSLHVCRHFLYYKLLQKEMLGEKSMYLKPSLLFVLSPKSF